MENRADLKEDLRIRRTFKLLSEALIALLEEKPFDHISVIDICDRAMVHRTTFYKHFEDKYDLIRYCIKNLEESFKSAGLKDHDPANPRTFYLNTIRLVLRYFIEHKRLILVLANRGQSDTVLAMVHDLISADVQQKLKEDIKNGISLSVPVPILAEYHIGAMTSVALWWLKNGMPYSEEKMINYIDSLMNVEKVFVKK